MSLYYYWDGSSKAVFTSKVKFTLGVIFIPKLTLLYFYMSLNAFKLLFMFFSVLCPDTEVDYIYWGCNTLFWVECISVSMWFLKLYLFLYVRIYYNYHKIEKMYTFNYLVYLCIYLQQQNWVQLFVCIFALKLNILSISFVCEANLELLHRKLCMCTCIYVKCDRLLR